MSDPRPTAPRIDASYGVVSDASGAELLPWAWALERLVAARNYWITTTRPDGRPHAIPVWGLWYESAVWFGTGRSSVKGRNLARCPHVVVHLESGDEVVILEGEAAEQHELDGFLEAYEAKYAIRPPVDESTVVYAVRPVVALTWLETDYPHTTVRWTFEDG
jgi:hypothetical protein